MIANRLWTRSDHNHFHGGTILNDAATSAIWVENQVSLGAGEAIMAKTHFEEWLWDLAGRAILHIHSINGTLLLMSFAPIALRNINLRVFQEFVLIFKMPILSMLFKPLCT